MNTNSEGLIVFILFIPLFWVLWLWVPTFIASLSGSLLTCSWYPADDRLKARHHMPRLSSLLSFSCYVLFCGRGQLSGAISHRALCVFFAFLPFAGSVTRDQQPDCRRSPSSYPSLG
jgi:hypothetical protein